MKLAILGGSFNPVHLGHTALATCAVEQYGYDRVAFVPAFNPPHKDIATGATSEDRCAMLSLAIELYSNFFIETTELERGGVSYTIDTIAFLEKKYGNCLEGPIGLIIGDDLLENFHLWKNVHELVSKTHVLLANRLDENALKSFDFSFEYTLMQNKRIDVSSQSIRESIRCGKDWKNHVSKGVYEYITSKGLYGESNR